MGFASVLPSRLQAEYRLQSHALRHWRAFLPSLLLLPLGLLYCVSPINLIADRRFYVGHLDEAAFLLAGLLASRLATGRIAATRHARRAAAPAPAPRPDGAINLGHMVLRAAPPAGAARTIIISGVARSGTSMIAHIVRQAGVPLGPTADPVVAEDTQIAAAARLGRASLRAIIAERNRSATVWGFKLPNIHTCLSARRLALFRNPVVILAVRDPVAVAQRNVVSMHAVPADALAEAVRDLQGLWRYASRIAVPVLLLSYEKAIRHPDHTVRLVRDFCGIGGDADPAGASPIRPEDAAYRQAASLPALPVPALPVPILPGQTPHAPGKALALRQHRP